MSRKNKILIVKLASIGDVLASTALPRVLIECTPNSEVHHLVMSNCSFAMANNPWVCKQHVMEFVPSGSHIRDLVRIVKIVIQLRREHFDVAFVLHRNIIFQSICWLAGIKKIYGFSSRINPFYDRHMPYHFDVNRTLQECEILRLAGFDVREPASLEFYPERNVLPAEILAQLPPSFIACNPGGGNPHSPADNRMWPIGHYAGLINKSPLPFVILGNGQSDAERASQLMSMVGSDKMINLVNKTSFSETALVLKQSSLYVGNDSSLMFLGAAMGIATLGIYGPTQVVAAKPIGIQQYSVESTAGCAPCYNPYLGMNGKMYTCKNNICMQVIGVDTVLGRVIEILNSRADAV